MQVEGNGKLITILVLIGMALLFLVQNVAMVEIQFLFWSTSMPRSLMIWVRYTFLPDAARISETE